MRRSFSAAAAMYPRSKSRGGGSGSSFRMNFSDDANGGGRRSVPSGDSNGQPVLESSRGFWRDAGGGKRLTGNNHHLRVGRDANVGMRRGEISSNAAARPEPQSPAFSSTSHYYVQNQSYSYGYNQQVYYYPQQQQQQPLQFRPRHEFRQQLPFRPHQPFRQPVKNHQSRHVPLSSSQHRPGPSRPPDYRTWEYARMELPPDCERFSILSYNILADYLAIDHRGKLYYHIPRHMLDWQWRRRSIVFELKLWSADIMCFQEVDRFQDLEEDLKLYGYDGIWKMRTGNPVDGCAIFWRASKLKLLHEESIEFNKLGLRDNVAQICVLGLQTKDANPNATHEPAGSPFGTSAGSSKIVVCNIHVLYNPKRGEIKLGQVRALLDRAHAVSKIWDNAPVVLCGDFNCTPKSALYNFITDQKLNLSGLDRDKVSGQASAEIHGPMSSIQFQVQPGNLPTQSPSVVGDFNGLHEQVQINEEMANSISLNAHDNVELTSISGTDGKTKNEDDEICCGSNKDGPLAASNGGSDDKLLPRSAKCGNLDDTGDISGGITAFSVVEAKEQRDSNLRNPDSEDSCYDGIQRGLLGELDANCSLLNSPSNATDTGNSGPAAAPMAEDCISKDQLSSSASEVNPSTELSSESSFSGIAEPHCLKYEEDVPSHMAAEDKETEGHSQASVVASSHMAAEDRETEGHSQASVVASSSHAIDRESCINEIDQSAVEDECCYEDGRTFLRALHNSEDAEAIPIRQPIDEFLPESNSDPVGGIATYDPSSWTPMEIATATGSSDCLQVEHPLVLKSSYTEVEDTSGTRDASGEPLVTSYNRCFMGTVDYIWHSEGLQTVGVLAPLPKDAMNWTSGFPTRKWGSDHIALVVEFALTRGAADQLSQFQ